SNVIAETWTLPLTVSVPGPALPGAIEPVPVTLPVMAPIPVSVAGLVTDTALVIEPLTARTPPVTVVAPPYVFVPPRTRVPPPLWLRPAAPSRLSEIVLVDPLFDAVTPPVKSIAVPESV